MKTFSRSIKIVLLWFCLLGSASLFAQKGPSVKKHPGPDSKDSVKGAGYYFDAATAKAQAGDCVNAIDLYDKCISMDPGTYDAYYNRAYCKMQLHDYEAAIADFTTCMRLYKGAYANALYLRGSCFNELKRYDVAISDFTKALDVSSNPDIYAARGLAYIQKGDFENAVSDYTHAIAKNPNQIELYGERAMCQYRAHHLKEAVEDAKKYLAKQPASSEIMEVELRAQIEMKDYANALETAKSFVVLDKSPKGFYYKGLIEFSQGIYQDGATDFSAAISLDNNYRDAYYSRGLCYHSLNDDANACKDMLKAKQLGFPNLDSKIAAYCKGPKQ